MRSFLLTVSAAVLLCPAVPLAAKHLQAEQYDVLIRLEKGGAADVTETVRFRFENGPFTFAFREIAANETDGIVNTQAWLDGSPCPAGTGPGQVEIQGTSPVKVRWHFAALTSGLHTFMVRYRALGVIRKGANGDALAWRALPNQRSYRIDDATITIEYPAGAVPVATPSIRQLDAQFQAAPGGAKTRLSEIAPKTQVVLTARFPAGSLASEPPRWQTLVRDQRNEFVMGMRNGAWIAAALAALSFFWIARTRSAFSTAPALAAGMELPEPPDVTKPALAAKLAQRVGGAAGTLLDLSRRGVLRIEETAHHRWTGRTFAVLREPSNEPLSPHEAVLLRTIFPKNELSAKMSDAGARIATHAGAFSATVQQELRDAGWIDSDRSRKKKTLVAVSVVAMIAGAAGFILGMVVKGNQGGAAGGLIFVVGLTAFVIGMAAVIWGASLTPWSDPGVIVASQWRAFARYLSNVSRGKAPLPGPDVFERFLPYAAAFGLAASWTKRYSKELGVPMPEWFAAMESGDGAAAASFVACMSSSGGAGGVAGAAGAAGASGGGSSGAG